MKICAPNSASGREYPSSFAASVNDRVNSRMGLNECPYKKGGFFGKRVDVGDDALVDVV
jgi:hypothetical protein